MEYKKYTQTQTKYTQASYNHGIQLSGELSGEMGGEIFRKMTGKMERQLSDQRLKGRSPESGASPESNSCHDSFYSYSTESCPESCPESCNYSESIAFDHAVNKNRVCKISGWASVSNIVDGHNDVITTQALNKAVQKWKDKNSQVSDKPEKLSSEKSCNPENKTTDSRDIDSIDSNIYQATNQSMNYPMNHPIMLLEHDLDKPIGVWQKLTVTDKGLFVEGIIFDELPASVLANTLLSSNKIHGLSIGYKPIKFHRKQGIRFITELEICEISIVQIPANPQATITCYALQ